jgi:hypothetical protein
MQMQLRQANPQEHHTQNTKHLQNKYKKCFDYIYFTKHLQNKYKN